MPETPLNKHWRPVLGALAYNRQITYGIISTLLLCTLYVLYYVARPAVIIVLRLRNKYLHNPIMVELMSC